MSRLNRIQNEIKQLEGGRFQKLCDMYLFRKYNWSNIMSLGSMDGTDKTTQGIPDTYYYDEDSKKYILVMFGTRRDSTKKLEMDIKEAIEKSKIDKKEIKEIICCHTSSNIKIEMDKYLRTLASPIKLTLIGIDTLSQELLKFEYQDINKEILGIEQSTEQVWKINEFVRIHDNSKTNARLSMPFIEDKDKSEVNELINRLKDLEILVIKGEPGVGKTRLAVEICNKVKDDFNVISVKSNNLSVYQDIKDALDITRLNYLFLDDANTITSLKAVIDLLLLPEFKYKLKIIMTIRDYAFSHIKGQIESFKVDTYTQTTMDENHIERLLKNLYKKIPIHLLTRIKKMSRYNPRLAVLAVEMIKEQGFESINNGKEILENYYGHIIRENNISNEEKIALFILSFFRKTNLNKEGDLDGLLRFFEIDYNTFMQSLHILHEKELCNIFQNRATKISDQSLADYILVNFVSDTKVVKIRDLFMIFYPSREAEIINLINVVNQFDSNEAWEEHLISEIKFVYNEVIDQNNKGNFLESFAALIPVEALDYVYNRIQCTDNVAYSISYEEFTSKVSNSNMNDPLILILCRLSNTSKMKKAVQLLLKYLHIRQDKVLEIFQALKECFNIENEWNQYLFKRNTVIESFLHLKNKTVATSFLIIKISEEYLKYSGELASWDEKNFLIQRYSLVDGKYLMNHHKRILELLLQIYKKGDKGINLVIDQLIENYPIYENENGYSQTVNSDLKFIKENFFGDIRKLTMRQENIVSKFNLECISLKLTEISFSDYIQSTRQKLYNALIAREAKLSLQELGYDEYQNLRYNKLIEAIEVYNRDYLNIFNVISEFMSDSMMKKDEREIEDSLFQIYSKINKNEKINFLSSLFQSNYSINSYHKKYFMEQLDYKDGIELLKILKVGSNKWDLANLLTNKHIDEEQSNHIQQFVNKNENTIYLSDYSILDFEQFIRRDENILKILLEHYENGVLLTNFFIPYYIREMEAKIIAKLVDKVKIKSVYLDGFVEQPIDQGGNLFKELMDNEFVYDFLVRLHLNNSIPVDKYNTHLSLIWSNEDFDEAIRLYINYLIVNKRIFYVGIDNTLKILFETKTDRVKKFVKGELENINNEKYMVNIINIATEIFSEEDCLDFYRILKSKQLSIESFKGINVLKLSNSWTGSMVPLLDKNIEFLNDLLEIFNDIHFIPHSTLLTKKIDIIQKEKEMELVKDYLDD